MARLPRAPLISKRFAFLRGHPSLLGTKFKFSKHGQSGLEISENLPHLALLVSVVITTVVLIGGLYYFRRMERTFADTV